jgi:hypothetical protein
MIYYYTDVARLVRLVRRREVLVARLLLPHQKNQFAGTFGSVRAKSEICDVTRSYIRGREGRESPCNTPQK